MDEDLWDVYDHTLENEVVLRRTDPNCYELFMTDGYDNACSMTLDRKHLKDLFNAIGNEIGAFSEPVQRNMITGEPIPSEFRPRDV